MAFSLQQQAPITADAYTVVPREVASAATQYQYFRAVEAEHLTLMARHNLLAEWTPDVRAVVLRARDQVRAARAARDAFRIHIRDFVRVFRDNREPLPAVLRQTRGLLRRLEAAGAIRPDGGWLEAEVLEWAIEEYDD